MQFTKIAERTVTWTGLSVGYRKLYVIGAPKEVSVPGQVGGASFPQSIHLHRLSIII